MHCVLEYFLQYHHFVYLQQFFKFLTVQWLHFTGEVGKFIIFWCEVSLWCCAQRLKFGLFLLELGLKINGSSFVWNTMLLLLTSRVTVELAGFFNTGNLCRRLSFLLPTHQRQSSGYVTTFWSCSVTFACLDYLVQSVTDIMTGSPLSSLTFDMSVRY